MREKTYRLQFPFIKDKHTHYTVQEKKRFNVTLAKVINLKLNVLCTDSLKFLLFQMFSHYIWNLNYITET